MGYSIEVLGLAGAICQLEAQRTWSGNRLKQAIEEAASIPVVEQLLMVGSAEFLDHEELEHKLGDVSTVTVTVVRKPKIVLGAAATPAQWLALYEQEKGSRPKDPEHFRSFVRNRGGQLAYTVARSVCQDFKDASKPSEKLPPAIPSRCLLPAPKPKVARAPGPSVEEEAAPINPGYLEVKMLGPGEECYICKKGDGGEAVEILCRNRHRLHKECLEKTWRDAEQADKEERLEEAKRFAQLQRMRRTLGLPPPVCGSEDRPTRAPTRPGSLPRRLIRAGCPVCRQPLGDKVFRLRKAGVFGSSPNTSSSSDAAWIRQS